MNVYDNPDDIAMHQIKNQEFAIVMQNNEELVFEGWFKIEAFTSEKIMLRLKRKSKVFIYGFGLKIGTICPNEIGIKGVIKSIEFGK